MNKPNGTSKETAEISSQEKRREEVLTLLQDTPTEKMLPLPEKPDAYFELSTSGYFLVPLARLQETRAREEGIANALRFMYAAAHGIGNLGKRKPISVSSRPDGMYDIVDGNSTYAVAAQSGWELIPATLVEASSH